MNIEKIHQEVNQFFILGDYPKVNTNVDFKSWPSLPPSGRTLLRRTALLGRVALGALRLEELGT